MAVTPAVPITMLSSAVKVLGNRVSHSLLTRRRWA